MFWIGAGSPPYKQWTGPPVKEYLEIIGGHRANWYFINGAFVVGVTLPGLATPLFQPPLMIHGCRG